MQTELAEHLNCSRSNLIRWASQAGVSLDAHSYKPEIKRAVLLTYEKLGRRRTEELFPDVSVRSIVERNYGAFKARQTRWTDAQIIEAARMAGLVSYKAQAKYFNRPGANEGAIHSLWVKRFQMGGGCVNGLVHWYAKELVTTKARYLRPLGQTRNGKRVQFRRLLLWTDMEKCLKRGTPTFIRAAIKTLADFQRWLHGAKDPRAKIIRMMREREAIHER